MTDQSIAWMREQKSLNRITFFIYYSSAGSHAPHHPPKKYIDKYKGKFDKGWDVIRQEIYQKQLAMGVIPKDTKLADKVSTLPVWDDMTAQQKKSICSSSSRYLPHLLSIPITKQVDLSMQLTIWANLTNTLVVYISGDNGTSAEGNASGQWNWNHF